MGSRRHDIDSIAGARSVREADATPSVTAARVKADLQTLLAEPLAPGLYLVATPIGNLGDMTLRAISVLARSDVVYCEDTRHSRTLLERFAISAPLKPYHEHNGRAQRPHILRALEEAQRVAVISDAGTPLVSDPGFKLVRAATEAGHPVVSIPGPSALLSALTPSGLPTDKFYFAGFLPARQAARRKRIAELARLRTTLVIFEAPSRLAATLNDLAEAIGDAPGCVARELTKLHEEVCRGKVRDLADRFQTRDVKGECVILAAPAGDADVSDAEIVEHLEPALATLSLKDAARSIADRLGIAKSRVYELGLQFKRRRSL